MKLKILGSLTFVIVDGEIKVETGEHFFVEKINDFLILSNKKNENNSNVFSYKIDEDIKEIYLSDSSGLKLVESNYLDSNLLIELNGMSYLKFSRIKLMTLLINLSEDSTFCYIDESINNVFVNLLNNSKIKFICAEINNINGLCSHNSYIIKDKSNFYNSSLELINNSVIKDC